jgi:hypothetical protein
MHTRILLALLIVGSTPQASEWVTAGHSDDGKVEVLVDVSSIRVGGAVRRVWVKTVLGRRKLPPAGLLECGAREVEGCGPPADQPAGLFTLHATSIERSLV